MYRSCRPLLWQEFPMPFSPGFLNSSFSYLKLIRSLGIWPNDGSNFTRRCSQDSLLSARRDLLNHPLLRTELSGHKIRSKMDRNLAPRAGWIMAT